MIKSKYFTYQELIKSPTASRYGISNEIRNTDHEQNLQRLVTRVLDPLRALVKSPIMVNSGYRSPEVNAKVGGASSSQHCKGEAADIECPKLANDKLAKIIATAFDFDQLILEFYTPGIPNSGWVHVSYREGRNRKQVLRAYTRNGRTVYEPFYFN